MANKLRVLDAARTIVDAVNELIETSPRKLIYESQLRDSAGSIAANIREAYGRRPGPERNVFFRYAIGSAQETDEHLRANFANRRIDSKRYWQMHNRLIAIQRMLIALMEE
ncbi:MAG TPA: four helix bundle protein [Gemmatimonadaceae bacterium]|nr:four helix bundle protein [Gemmatimonadaceae bacterium]